jgi:hypothetical protein
MSAPSDEGPATIEPPVRSAARRSIGIAASRFLTAGSLIAVAGLCLGSNSAAAQVIPADRPTAAPARAADMSSAVPRLGHVFVIVGENTSLRQLTPKRAPYIAGRLRRHAAWLVGYKALTNSSSLGNYIEMTSAQSIRCERNNSSPVNLNTDKPICHQNVNNIFHQLQVRGTTWKEWNESMPNPCAFVDSGTAWSGDIYSVHHNPAMYYDNIEGARYVEDYNMAPRKTCLKHVVPMGTTTRNNTSAFDSALRRGVVPRFNYIVPNDCENGHDPCGSRPIGQYDRFVRREVAKIKASPAYGPRSVIVVTWDEQGDATPHNARVGSLWIGPHVKAGTYRGDWSHASLLGTIERAYGLPLLADARKAAPINQIWK